MDNNEEGAEEARRKKLYEQRMRQMQAELQQKELLRRMLSDGAYERMMNVRISNAELYEKVVSSLAYLAQTGKMTGKISDEQIYSLLQKMTEKREPTIEFRSK